MSLFRVAIFSNFPNEYPTLLAPYFEETENEAYLVSEPVDIDIDDARGKYNEWGHEEYPTFRDFIAGEYVAEYDEDENCAYHPVNPNAKYDWFDDRNMLAKVLCLKDGTLVNSAQMKDLDISRDESLYRSAIRQWEISFEGSVPRNDIEKYTIPKFDDFDKRMYFNRYRNKETYADFKSRLPVEAFVTPDGEWFDYEGEYPYIGEDQAHKALLEYMAKLNEMLEKSDPETYLTTIMCHY